MSVRETSLAAYESIESSLSAKQREVMLVMHGAQAPLTRKQIAKRLGWEINRVTGRVLECIEKGFLEEHGTTVENGRTAHLVRVKPKQGALDLAA